MADEISNADVPGRAGDAIPESPATTAFRAARDLLFQHRHDLDAAVEAFRWPALDEFNWALDWFDVLAAAPNGGSRTALWLVHDDGTELRLSFAELAERSSRVANWLRAAGVRRGDHVLVVLGNQVELWETVLACVKLGAVIIPATTMLGPDDLADRVTRGRVRHVVSAAERTAGFDGVEGDWTRISVGRPVEGWHDLAEAGAASPRFVADGPTRADDPLLLYFTSGTTALPKLVRHTHSSYPVGHLSTMYWLGLRPGDVHVNVSSPGWAKHAWSSLFAPWNAEATVLVVDQRPFVASRLLDEVERCGATTLCAPPTVWRMLVQEELERWSPRLREVVAAGEPLNPEVIDRVRRAWDLTVRDGYGQTETTAQVGNTPGQPVTPGSMGRPLPGYDVELVDPEGAPAREGEITIPLAGGPPAALMVGYQDAPEQQASATRDGRYHTGDVARWEPNGHLTYVGRVDDVFKASDYRISPFELESVLLEHPAVLEAAVVPAPDPVRLAVPKAYVALAEGHEPSEATARSILAHARTRLAPYKRVRRLEFGELPKTVSGKIRRVELRGAERAEHRGTRRADEYRDTDFPELRG